MKIIHILFDMKLGNDTVKAAISSFFLKILQISY